MVGAKQLDTVGQLIKFSVAKNQAGFRGKNTGPLEMTKVGVKSNLAEYQNDFHTVERPDLFGHVDGTIGDFDRRGFVVRRRAVDDGGDVEIAELLAVVFVQRGWLRGKAGAVQDATKEVSGAVAGKGAACAIGTMSPGSKAKYEESR